MGGLSWLPTSAARGRRRATGLLSYFLPVLQVGLAASGLSVSGAHSPEAAKRVWICPQGGRTPGRGAWEYPQTSVLHPSLVPGSRVCLGQAGNGHPPQPCNLGICVMWGTSQGPWAQPPCPSIGLRPQPLWVRCSPQSGSLCLGMEEQSEAQGPPTASTQQVLDSGLQAWPPFLGSATLCCPGPPSQGCSPRALGRGHDSMCPHPISREGTQARWPLGGWDSRLP